MVFFSPPEAFLTDDGLILRCDLNSEMCVNLKQMVNGSEDDRNSDAPHVSGSHGLRLNLV